MSKNKYLYRIYLRDHIGCWFCSTFSYSILTVVAWVVVNRKRCLGDEYKVLRNKFHDSGVVSPIEYEDITDLVRRMSLTFNK